MVRIIENVKVHLRNDFRIKEGTDYAILHKYGKNAILCLEEYQERINEIAEKHGLKVDYWYTTNL